MKSRNATFGFLAALLAVGSAFASLNMINKTPAVKYRSAQGVTKCVQASGFCNEPGPFKCRISITANGVMGIYQAFEFPVCFPLLTHTNSAAVSSVIINERVTTIYNPVHP